MTRTFETRLAKLEAATVEAPTFEILHYLAESIHELCQRHGLAPPRTRADWERLHAMHPEELRACLLLHEML